MDYLSRFKKKKKEDLTKCDVWHLTRSCIGKAKQKQLQKDIWKHVGKSEYVNVIMYCSVW